MKRALYILSIITVTLLLSLGMLCALLYNGEVQTALVRVVTEELSRGLETKLSVGKVLYRFPAKLCLKDIYIEDQMGDTLSYISEGYAIFHPLAMRNNEVHFSNIRLTHIRAYGHKLPSGEYNYDFILNAFASNDTAVNKLTTGFKAERILLEDVMVVHDNNTLYLDQFDASLRHFDAKELDMSINDLQGYISKDGRPLYITQTRIDWLWNDTTFIMPRLYVSLPNSKLDASGMRIRYPHNKDKDIMYFLQQPIGEFLHKAKDSIQFSIDVNEVRLTPSDLSFLSANIRNLDKQYTFSGTLEGRLDSLSAHHLSIYDNTQCIIKGNVTAIGLPDWRNMYLKAECEELLVNAAMIQDIVSDVRERPFRLPSEVQRLGSVRYKGLLKGYLHELTLKGAFRTALGSITTDATIKSDSTFNNTHFAGRISTTRFRLGTMLNNKDFNKVSMTINADAWLYGDGTIIGKVNANITDFGYRGYTYQRISLNGNFTKDTYKGSIDIDDPNIKTSIAGMVNMSKSAPEIDLSLRIERLLAGQLNLTERYIDSDIGFSLRAHTKGIHPDSINGQLYIDSLRLRNGNDSIIMKALEVTAEAEGKSKRFKLVSDWLTARIKGDFEYSTLPITLQKAGIQYMSELFPNSIKQNANKYTTSNQLDFYIYGHELKRLQRVLDLPMRISDNPVLKGFINEDKNQWGVQGYIPYIRTESNTVREITLSADNITGKANASISADWFDSHYVLRTTTADNHTDIDLTALDSTHTITSHVQMGAEYASKKNKPVIDLNIEPSSIYMMDSIYNLTQSHIQYIVSDTLLTVSNFHIGTNSQFIAANGKASPYHTDSLKVQLGHINAGYIMPYVVADETIAIGGDLSGWAVIYGLFSKPMFEADVRLDSAFLNEECIGDAIARVVLNREDNTIDINADVVKGTHTVAHVDGKVIPAENYWGLEIYPDSISIGFINHWTQGILDDIKGYASGYVNVFGRGKATWVLARVKAEEASLTIPYTGCRYHLTDSVFMDSTSIRFDNLTLYDDEGNAMPFNGILRHLYFKNFSFSIDAYPHHTLAINLPDKAGEWIQGKVYADGDVHINGNDDEVHLDANAKAVGKSRFRMSVAGASTADDNGFITFVNHNQVKAKQEDDEDFSHAMIERKYISHGPKTKFLLGINIDITPELLFQLVINDRTGDMLQGRGDGSLRFTYDDSSEAMRLLGTFAIQSGSFGFTVGNLVRREFTIAEGSSVTWNGNPESPDLNVTAKYRVTASLKDLFGDEINSLATTRTSVPVNTCLSLLGRLEEPTIRFSLELPQADDAIQNQVRSMINTDEMMMRQVVYLLVFGRFYTPEYVKSSGSADGLNETYSLLSSTITGQINSWLSKLTNVFTMGVNIRSEGSGQNASQEYEAQFQIQPVDRLVINGNVGYRYNDISNRPFFGDLDVEYLITPNGKLRIKAYTHTVDKYSLRQATTTQGVGFVFKHDFNWKKDQ